MVREEGLEPSRPFGHRHLKPARLPIPPLARVEENRGYRLFMGLRDLERAIERGVDGVLGRVFRAEVSGLEIAKRVERELEAGARRGGSGDRVMPNDIEVRINPVDVRALGVATGELERELLLAARDHAREASCRFEGPLRVVITPTKDAQKGTIEVFATTEHAVPGIPPGTLVYPSGYRLDLAANGAEGIVLGRDIASDVVIEDDKASRSHARLRPSPQGWIVEDLDSTNGTRVNGFRTSAQLLSDGDHVTVGATTFLFDAS